MSEKTYRITEAELRDLATLSVRDRLRVAILSTFGGIVIAQAAACLLAIEPWATTYRSNVGTLALWIGVIAAEFVLIRYWRKEVTRRIKER